MMIFSRRNHVPDVSAVSVDDVDIETVATDAPGTDIISTSAPSSNTGRRIFIAALLTAITACWGHSAHIVLKAQVAQWLIKEAWATTLTTGAWQTPWRWADTWPVARLRSSALPEDLYVLWGNSGTSLAFGPGHSPGSAMPNTQGTTVISGHRDTHFEFLQTLEHGNIIELQNSQGQWQAYRIATLEVRDVHTQPLTITPNQAGLVLITCYPFNSVLTHGPLRYVIFARPLDYADLGHTALDHIEPNPAQLTIAGQAAGQPIIL